MWKFRTKSWSTPSTVIGSGDGLNVILRDALLENGNRCGGLWKALLKYAVEIEWNYENTFVIESVTLLLKRIPVRRLRPKA